MNEKFEIAVLTATLNADKVLPNLIKSLRDQTDKNFIWIVSDGLSSDSTRELVAQVKEFDVRIISASDFGIYDALNKGILSMPESYYLVVGADDTLDKNAIENYRKSLHLNNFPDFVSASILVKRKVLKPHKRLGWLWGMRGVASGHAVGLLIKKNLHSRFGMYSNKFPIMADQLFVKTAINNGASIVREQFLAGEFSMDGFSSSDLLGAHTEFFRIQIITEKFKTLQFILFFVRILKLYLMDFKIKK